MFEIGAIMCHLTIAYKQICHIIGGTVFFRIMLFYQMNKFLADGIV